MFDRQINKQFSSKDNATLFSCGEIKITLEKKMRLGKRVSSAGGHGEHGDKER